ncbi:MAG: T9SS type A sorting domain-containing protein [Candidatus Kapabacteria bacterium]|nr:T9SS type A sorting domain-containing protein [Candidatus Kapabacteria bacterium]
MRKLVCLLFILTLFQTSTVLSEWEHKFNAVNEQCYVELDGKLYRGFTNGLSIYHLKKNQEKFYTMLNSDLPGNYVNSMILLEDKSILVSTDKGLAVIENGVITTNKPICTTYPDNDSRKLYLDEFSNIWTFSAQKVHLFKDNEWKTFDLSTQNIPFPFEILELFVDGDSVLAMFHNQLKSGTSYYYNTNSDLYLSIAIINENGISYLWLDNQTFPYRQGGYSLIRSGDELWFQNYNAIFKYKNDRWDSLKVFNFGNYKPYFSTQSFFKDKFGRVWTILEDTLKKIRLPASYDPSTNKVKVYLENEKESFYYISVLSNDNLMIWNHSTMVLYDIETDTWKKSSSVSLGIPENCLFFKPRILNGKIYVFLSVIYQNYSYDYTFYGNLFCIEDKTVIPKLFNELPYSSLVQCAINKKGQGLFKGRFVGEELKVQTSSGFVQQRFYSNVFPVVALPDGNIYFSKFTIDRKNIYSTIATWDDSDLVQIDMGFKDKNADLSDIDYYQDNIITMGTYYYDPKQDSATTCISIYNTKTKKLNKYDKFNSGLPDYYFEKVDIIWFVQDTVPKSISVDDAGNVWLMTSMSLIKFKDGKVNIFDLPKNSDGSPLSIPKIFFDGNSKQLIAYFESFEPHNYYTYRAKFYFFDTFFNQWDSTDIKGAGIIGKLVRMKKLLDGNVWACDNLGYFYKYSGDGKFKIFDLRINNRPNLGFQINDFSMDVNGYLHLATDIGLLSNKSILLNVEENDKFSNELKVYPNPFNDKINIELPNDDIIQFELIDIFGRRIIKSYGTNYLNTETISAGLYILKVQNSNNQSKSIKVIKY